MAGVGVVPAPVRVARVGGPRHRFRRTRNRIVTTSSPRMAASQAAQREPRPLRRTVHLDRAEGVGRTCRPVATDTAVHRTDREAVGLQQADQQVPHRRPEPLSFFSDPRQAEWNSSARSPEAAAGGNARITRSVPRGGTTASPVAESSARASSRRRRFTRLRMTALPTALDTTKPTRGTASAAGVPSVDAEPAAAPPAGPRVAACTTSVGRPTRTPRRITCWKSCERRSRWAALNTTVGAAGFRPTARRGPCCGARPEWPARRGYACGHGTHGYGCAAGCSAGKCACSLEYSRCSMTVKRLWCRSRKGATKRSPCRQRPAYGSQGCHDGQTVGRPANSLPDAVHSTRRGHENPYPSKVAEAPGPE